MWRARPASVSLRLILAVIVLLGMSPAAVPAFNCAAGLCGTECGMHEKAPPPPQQDDRSCCPKNSDGRSDRQQPVKDGCKCEFKAGTDAVATAQPITAPTAPLVPVILPPCLDMPAKALPAHNRSILFHSDSSPPNIFHHPDFGRAPPSA